MILTIGRIKTGEHYFHEHSSIEECWKRKDSQKKVENHPSATLTAAISSSKTTDQFHDIS